MPLPHGYSETLHSKNDRFAAEATWHFFAKEDREHCVLPDGRCDLILSFRSDGTKLLGAITPLVAGAATKFYTVSIMAGTGYVGVRLRPGTAHAVLGMNLSTIADRGIVGEDVLKAVPDLNGVCDRVLSIDILRDRLASFIERRSVSLTGDPLTADLIDTIHLSGGRLSIAEIATLHRTDVRTVRRRITFATGLPPKKLAMVVQFQRALRLRFQQGLDAASTALEAGYADQAHMSRVFRQMGGISPARLPDLVLAGLPV